jgi:hypothetical protein
MNGSTDLAGRYAFLADPAFKELSPEIQKQVFAAETAGAETQALGGLLEKFYDPERRRQTLKDASEFDKERMKEAAKYKALFDLPGTIMNAVTTPGIIAAQGAGNIANIMTQGAQNIPALTRFERGSYSYTPTRYFG